MIIKFKDSNGITFNLNQIVSNISNVFNPNSEEAMSGIALQQALNRYATQESLPIIYIDGTLPTSKEEGTVIGKFRYVAGGVDFESYAQYKIQGSSSANFPKKPYNIKLFNDEACTEPNKVSFKNWTPQNLFTLKADWRDVSHTKNIVSNKIFAKMAETRNDIADYPVEFKQSMMLAQIDGFEVKVMVNGVYYGIYTLCTKKDPYVWNMNKTNNNQCMLQLNKYAQYNLFRENATIVIDGGDTCVEDQLHSTAVPANIQTSWNNVINFVKDSTDEEFRNNFETYFYKSSVIDAFIYIICGGFIDNITNNQLFATYDGTKWMAVMYDMDIGWGTGFNDSSLLAYNYPRDSFNDYQNGARTGNLLYMRLVENFGKEINDRYNQLRKTVLSNTNLLAEFNKFSVADEATIAKDYAATTANGAFTSMPKISTLASIQNWIVNRFTSYCDSYFDSMNQGIVTSISATYTGGNIEEGTTTAELTGITVTAHYDDDTTGVVSNYTIEDGTVIVGENTFTISYKGFTTTITVTGVEKTYIGWQNMSYFDSLPVGTALDVSISLANVNKRYGDAKQVDYFYNSFLSNVISDNNTCIADLREYINSHLDIEVPTEFNMYQLRKDYPTIVTTIVKIDENNNFAIYNKDTNQFVSDLTTTKKASPWSSGTPHKFTFIAPWANWNTSDSFLATFAQKQGYEQAKDCDMIFRLSVDDSSTTGFRLNEIGYSVSTGLPSVSGGFDISTGTGGYTSFIFYVWEETEIPAAAKAKLGL